MTKKREQQILASLKLDGCLSKAAARANVSRDAVRWRVKRYEHFKTARAAGKERAAKIRADAIARRCDRLEKALHRAEDKLTKARSGIVRDLPKLNVQEVRARIENVETRMQEVSVYRSLLKGRKRT